MTANLPACRYPSRGQVRRIGAGRIPKKSASFATMLVVSRIRNRYKRLRYYF